MPDWNWGESQSEDGVVHESVANTDHDNTATLKQGYSVSNPYLSADLQGFYPVQEDSGTTINDFSGNNNDATLNGGTLNGGDFLGTDILQTDGVDDYIDTPVQFADTDDFTITGWLKLLSFTGNFDCFMAQRDAYSTMDWQLYYDNRDGENVWYVGIGEGNASQNNTGVEQTTGSWEYITLTKSGSDYAFYKDASSVFSVTDSTGWTTSDTIAIASLSTGAGGDTNAEWADLRMYNTALSASQVQTLYDVVATQDDWLGAGKLL